MTLLAGWSALLSRLSGQSDVVIGTPVANRPRRELESLLGFFANTLALRVRLEDDPSVAELLSADQDQRRSRRMRIRTFRSRRWSKRCNPRGA